MARSSKPRRTQSSRKPVTIDLEAKEVDVAPEASSEADAEPVAFESINDSDTPPEPKAGQQDGISDDATLITEPSPAASKHSGISGILNGLIGGLIALLGGAVLQWGGVLPSFGTTPAPVEQVDIAPLQGEIDALKLQLAEVTERTGAGEIEIPQSLTNQISAALQASDEALSTASSVEQALGEVNSSVTELQSAVSSGDAGENAGLEALSQRLDGIDGKVESLASNTASVDDGVVSKLASDIAAVDEKIDGVEASVASHVATLTDRMVKFEENSTGGQEGTRVAAAIAAAGLKSAVDRGGPFMTELEAFATVSTNDEVVSELRKYAASGVPTVNKLSEEFPSVANRIVATGRGLTEDASVADRLMASARSLVQVRPVGEVEGDTPGAIAARVEGRLQGGDLAAALAEWEALPDAAKAASTEFADRMRARKTVDSMVSKALTGAMAATTPSTN